MCITPVDDSLDVNTFEIDDKIDSLNIPREAFLNFSRIITLFPEDVTTEKVKEFINDNFEAYSTLYTTFRCIKKQIEFLRSHDVEGAGIIYKEGELQFHTGESVNEFVDKLEKNRPNDFILSQLNDYVLTQFKIVKPREIDEDSPLSVSYQLKDWNQGYCVELVETYATSHFWGVFTSRHSFLRLIDDQGNVVSVGKFPKEILWERGNYMRQANQRLSCPDPCDCKYPIDNQHAVRIPLTKEQYEGLSKDIKEELVDLTNGISRGVFNYFEDNCARWCLETLSKHTDIEIDPSSLKTTITESILSNYMPRWMSKALNSIASVGLYFSGLILIKYYIVWSQGGLQNNDHTKNSKPVVDGYLEFFGPNFTTFIPPQHAVAAVEKKMKEHLDEDPSYYPINPFETLSLLSMKA